MQQLGIDIGGSGIKAAIVNTKTGEFLTDRYKVKTPQPSTPNEIAQEIKLIIDHFNWNNKVGCCFPSTVRNGKCLTAGNISKEWIGVQIDELFSKTCNNLEFSVGNDADLAGVAEIHLGAGKNLTGKVVMFTIGTGIGSGLFYNGKLIPNTEFGQLLHNNGQPIEFYAANSARKKENLELDEWAERFNYFLHRIKDIFIPNHIILGGGISKRFDEFIDHLNIDIPIHQAQFLNRAGIIGSAMYAIQEEAFNVV